MTNLKHFHSSVSDKLSLNFVAKFGFEVFILEKILGVLGGSLQG